MDNRTEDVLASAGGAAAGAGIALGLYHLIDYLFFSPKKEEEAETKPRARKKTTRKKGNGKK